MLGCELLQDVLGADDLVDCISPHGVCNFVGILALDDDIQFMPEKLHL